MAPISNLFLERARMRAFTLTSADSTSYVAKGTLATVTNSRRRSSSSPEVHLGLVVTGILHTGDIRALEASLKEAGLPLDPIQLISGDDSTEGVARRQIGPRLMTGDHAGYVPGINSSGGGLSYFRNESLADRLGDLEIPDSEVDNYVEALEAGRSVVAYFAKPDSLAVVETIFRDSGLAKVKTF
jgi:hypothetical protein